MGSNKKHRTTFCGKPVCVAQVQCLKGAKTEDPKRLRERNMSLYSVRNYLLGFRLISEVDILVQKTWISAVPRKTGIPDIGKTLHNLYRESPPLETSSDQVSVQ